jgi:hypothetical protein
MRTESDIFTFKLHNARHSRQNFEGTHEFRIVHFLALTESEFGSIIAVMNAKSQIG